MKFYSKINSYTFYADFSRPVFSMPGQFEGRYSKPGFMKMKGTVLFLSDNDRSTIQQLGRMISIDKVDKDRRSICICQQERVFPVSLISVYLCDIARIQVDFNGFLNMKSKSTLKYSGMDFYPTYDAYVDMMYQFAALYPSLCQVSSIGTTVRVGQLLVAKISDNWNKENEPQFPLHIKYPWR